MSYRHGITINETNPTVPSPETSALTVAIGTAPVNMGLGQIAVNKPYFTSTREEAINVFGYSEDFDKFTISEVINTHFELYKVGPVVFINVLDPTKHKTSQPETSTSLSNGVAVINKDGILLDSVKVKATAAGALLVKGTDYVISFNEVGKPAIGIVEGGSVPLSATNLFVEYDFLDPSKVTNADIIGGYDSVTGNSSGLELVNAVFPLYGVLPGVIIAPKYSESPEVASILRAKADNVNNLFKAVGIADLDQTQADTYTKAPSEKEDNGLTHPMLLTLWGSPKYKGKVYHYSTHAAAVIAKTDAENDNLPYVSPSNKKLIADALVVNGKEIPLALDHANYLNGNGIVTALNLNGFRLWGNRTSAYPGSKDIKDTFIPTRRMFNYISNKLIIDFWDQVDNPATKRLVDTFTDGFNIWLNSLVSIGALVGGRIEFRAQDNPSQNLIDGRVKFRVFIASPTPAEDIEVDLEFDISYLNSVFA